MNDADHTPGIELDRQCSLGLLLAAHLAFTFLLLLALQTVPEPADGLFGARGHFVVFYLTVGWFFAQSSLLGTWAALADSPALRRYPIALFLLGLCWLASAASIRLPIGWLQIRTIATICTVIPFVVSQLLLVLRIVGPIRLVDLENPHSPVRCRGYQFSLLYLFGWISGAALLLALARLLPRAGGDDPGSDFLRSLAIMALFAAPYTALLARVVCATYDQKRDAWLSALAGVYLGLMLIAELIVLAIDSGDDFVLYVFPAGLTLGFVTVFSLAMLREAGYRLKRMALGM